MPCIQMNNVILCSMVQSFVRLRTYDGRYVFMEHHAHFGPNFYHDRACDRVIENWWDDSGICRAMEWFYSRGERG